MKKTLIVTLDYPPRAGGVARYYENLVSRLPSGELVVLAPPEPGSESFDAGQDYRIIRCNFYARLPFVWPAWLALVFKLSRIVKQERIEVIVAGQVLPVGTAVSLVSRLTNLPYLVCTHGLDITLPQNSRRRQKTMRAVLERARTIVANSEYTRQELEKFGLPQRKITVISPGCSLTGSEATPEQIERLGQRLDILNKKIVITVGRLEERKGHELVLKSLSRLREKFPELRYVVVGAGPAEMRLKVLTKEMGLQQLVHFAGFVPEAELPAYYALADVLAMPARQLPNRDVEGFGIVFLEANAYGKPVIGGRSGGVGEAVIDGQTGLLVDPVSVGELAAAIERLISDPTYAARLGSAGRARVERDFRWTDRARAFEGIINSLS